MTHGELIVNNGRIPSGVCVVKAVVDGRLVTGRFSFVRSKGYGSVDAFWRRNEGM
ncbi:MAG: hypothetical protein JXA18_00535 [Chitinispirillaceae bacterium]|nr:hypothetical protein [Chitinispirillaceae bacterium]